MANKLRARIISFKVIKQYVYYMSGIVFGIEETKMNEPSEKEHGSWSHILVGMNSSSPIY